MYQSDLANRTMIAEDVSSFICSEDGQTILYLDKNGAVFRWTAGGGILRVTDDASLSKGFAQKKMAVYYVKDGTLYEYTVNSETPKQIATGVQDVVWITPDGQVYYTASADGGMTMMDFVEDDIAQGGTVTMPEAVSYTHLDVYKRQTLMAPPEEVAGFTAFLERYKKALPMEKAAIETM